MKDQIHLAPCRRIEGIGALPGDKSIAHRAVLISMMNEGRFAVAGIPRALDVLSSLAAARHLLPDSYPEVQLEAQGGSTTSLNFQLSGESPGLALLGTPRAPIDVGNSGTTIRLLAGILAGAGVTATLTGDDSIRRRPMGRVVDPLRRMGANVRADDGRAPILIEPAQLTGTDHVLPVASAQVKSALLLAGLSAEGTTSVTEPARSRDHTERMLRTVGVQVDISTDRCSVSRTDLRGDLSLAIPGDLSAAAFLLVAAAILPGSDLIVDEAGLNPTRTGIIDVLTAYGARIDIDEAEEIGGEPRGRVRVRAGDRRPLTVEGDLTVRSIDELPVVAVLASYAEGTTTVADAGELRVKESDRIAAIVEGLSALGVDIRATPDGFTVRGGRPLRGGLVRSHGDHRIAMALAVAALGATGPTVIEGWGAVDISYPGFAEVLAAVTVD